MGRTMRAFAFVATVLGLSLPAEVSAQTTAGSYPTKPVRLIAPSAPGSPPDVVARMLGEPLAAALGQPVIVENRPGAMSTVGLAAVAKAPPDGHTLGVVTLPAVAAPSLLAHMPYDTAKDLAPIRQLIWSFNLLVVRTGAPFASLEDLVAAAKARPGQIRFASGGNGTPAHLSGELFRLGAGIHIEHIPFKGTVPGITAVMGGQVDLMFATAGVAASHIKTGKLRALATSAPARIAAFPDVFTMQELGYAEVAVRDWLGIVAPAATPRSLADRISVDIGKALQQGALRERLIAVGYEPVEDSDPQKFARLLQFELARWATIVREAGIKAD